MAEQSGKYYTKFGFSHLTRTGKFGFILIFAVAAWVAWQIWISLEWSVLETEEKILELGVEYGVALLIGLGAGLIVAYLAVLLLPRKSYARQEFYCSSCGNFIGYRIDKCTNCGSNKYTIDPELAAIRAKQKTEKNQTTTEEPKESEGM